MAVVGMIKWVVDYSGHNGGGGKNNSSVLLMYKSAFVGIHSIMSIVVLIPKRHLRCFKPCHLSLMVFLGRIKWVVKGSRYNGNGGYSNSSVFLL
jgi:hypothetical protein